jgi:hypothetical protein
MEAYIGFHKNDRNKVLCVEADSLPPLDLISYWFVLIYTVYEYRYTICARRHH